MQKLCRLELNNSGAWKLLARFDAADAERADDLMNAAAQLADVVNEGEKKPAMTLRIATDEPCPEVLMRYVGPTPGGDSRWGWIDARTGEPA